LIAFSVARIIAAIRHDGAVPHSLKPHTHGKRCASMKARPRLSARDGTAGSNLAGPLPSALLSGEWKGSYNEGETGSLQLGRLGRYIYVQQ
jgi:hypothetical protein